MLKRFYFNIILIFFVNILSAQNGYYYSLEEAVQNKDSVISLAIKHKHLKSFPKEILDMPNLERLDLSRNSIKEIPTKIDTLKHLHYINFAQNHLEYLPYSMSLMPIDSLILWDNQIKYFDNSFSKLSSLKYLDIRAIQMTRKQQKAIKQLFPNATIKKDYPCNCGR